MGKTLAFIPARGGSKRIPHKNIKDFCGKPMMQYSIEAALDSGVFDEVMVSTESESVATLGKAMGASVPFLRSAENANDLSTVAQVTMELMEAYRNIGQDFESVCCIYATAPFVTGDTLKKAYEMHMALESDCVLSVVEFSFPPLRGMVKEGEFIHMKWPEHMQTRSQDLQPFYHDAGQFALMRTCSFLTQKVMMMEKTIPFLLPETQVQDIDNETDWEIAELKYKRWIQRKAEGVTI